MKFHFRHRGQAQTIELLSSADGSIAIVGKEQFGIQLLGREEGEISFKIDGEKKRAHWVRDGVHVWLRMDGRSYLLERLPGKISARDSASGSENILRAPMPGQVKEVLVKIGESVAAGDTLLVLEAMKMELRIQAPNEGKVVKLMIKQGESVEKDQILVEIGAEDAK